MQSCTKNRVKWRIKPLLVKWDARVRHLQGGCGSLRRGPRGGFGRGLQPVRAWFASLRPYAMQGPAASKNQQLVANRREGHEVGRGEQVKKIQKSDVVRGLRPGEEEMASRRLGLWEQQQE